MKKNTALKILNPVLAVLMLNQVLTGLFREALPGEAFEVLHEGAGMVLAAAALLHLVLNWSWVRASFFRSPARPAA